MAMKPKRYPCSAEVPGLVVAGLAVELLGRKTPIAAGLVISGGAILALQVSLALSCSPAGCEPRTRRAEAVQ